MGAPDLVVEVLAPWTARYDQGDKLLRYARSGVVKMWVVDPEDSRVKVCRFDREGPIRRQQVLGSVDVLRTDLLPGFELPLGRLFRKA